MSSVTFTKSDGAFGTTSPNEDGVAGIILEGAGTAHGPFRITGLKDFDNYSATNSGSMPANEFREWIEDVYLAYKRITGRDLAELYVYYTAADAVQADVETLQQFANGRIRLIALGGQRAALGDFDAHLTMLGNASAELYLRIQPACFFTAPDTENAGEDPLVASTGPLVSNFPAKNDTFASVVVVGETFNSGTYENYARTGLALGTAMATAVQSSIGKRDTNNLIDPTTVPSDPFPYELSGFGLSSFNRQDLQDITNAAVLHLVREPNKVGAFWNLDRTLAPDDSDYNRLRRERTVQALIRDLQAAYVDRVQTDVLKDPDDTLTDAQVKDLESVGNRVLDRRTQAGNISAGKVTISENLTFNSTIGKWEISGQVRIIEVGVAEAFFFDIGFATEL